MAFLRSAVRSDAVIRFLSWCAAGYIRLVWLTGRWHVEFSDGAAKLLNDREPIIACFWHGRMLALPNVWHGRTPRMNVLSSQHRDGEFMARTSARLGLGTIWGSTSRGGGAGLLGIVRTLRLGECVCITPDGPRGPLMTAAPGASMAAKISGAPLVPVTYGARLRFVTSSWDRLVIPLPFTKGIVRLGEPQFVPRNADEAAISAASQRLEAELIRITEDVDRALGLQPVIRDDPKVTPARKIAP